MKTGKLSLLEPSGLVQACTGITVPEIKEEVWSQSNTTREKAEEHKSGSTSCLDSHLRLHFRHITRSKLDKCEGQL